MGTLKKIFTASLWAVLALLGLGGLASAVPFTASVMTNPIYSATEMPPSAVVREAWGLDTDRPQPLTLGLEPSSETSAWRFNLAFVNHEHKAMFKIQHSSDPGDITVPWNKIAWVLSPDGKTTVTWNLRAHDDPRYRIAQVSTCLDYGSSWYYSGCQQWGTADLTVTDNPVDYLVRNIDSVIVTITEGQYQAWFRP